MQDQLMFQMSADTRFLVQRLSKASVGDLITYEDLSREVGKAVSGSFSALTSARRALLRDQQRVFDVVTGKGLKRLNDIEIVATGERTSQRIRRTARRGVRTLTAVADFSSLPREYQMRHTAAVSIFGVIAEMSTHNGIAKVEKIAENMAAPLPIAQTLAAFTR
jgi:hypothetical protein